MSFSCLHAHHAMVPTRTSICLFPQKWRKKYILKFEANIRNPRCCILPPFEMFPHTSPYVSSTLWQPKQPPGRPMPLLLLLLCCPLCPLCELGLLPPCHHQTLGRMLSWRAALLNAVWPIGGWLQRKIKSAGGMAPPPELNQPRRS